MDLSKLSDDQLEIALKVADAARRQGLNPDFVLPMVMAESGFNQNAVSPSGAVGVMQLIPSTSKSLKVDPKNIDENIDGGMRLLKELVENPKIGNDPYKVLAGYNASTETRNKFYESGNLADLKDETINHMIKVSEYYGGDLPSALTTAQEEPKPSEGEAGPSAGAVGSTDETIPSQAGEPVSAKLMGALGAGTGVVGGTAAGVLAAKRDAAERGAEWLDSLKNKGAAAAEDTSGMTPGEKYAKKTGYGEGKGTVKNVVDRQKLQSPSGKLAKRVYEHNKAVQSLSAAESAAEEAAVAAKAAQAAEETSPLWKYARHLASMPVKGALTGAGLVGGATDVYNRAKQGLTGEAALSAVGNVAGAAAPWLSGAVAAPLAGMAGVAAPLYLTAADRLRYLQKHPEEHQAPEVVNGMRFGPMGEPYRD
jgi:hypothetical protein